MADAARSDAAPRLSVAGTWRRLGVEQRVEAVGALLLMVSTIGPFSFVEGAILLLGTAILLLLRKRAERRRFHIPFGDGTMVAVAGVWAGILIFVRLFDRPLGQGLLALACAGLLVAAGLRERAKRPPDDLADRETEAAPRDAADVAPAADAAEPAADRARYRDETVRLSREEPSPAPRERDDETPTRPIPAKVLPPPPSADDLEDPPAYEGPPRPNRG